MYALGLLVQEKAARLTVRPIADAVDHLHCSGIMHRNLA
jgi:serine/threonine protein kinase